MPVLLEADLIARDVTIGIVVSRFNDFICDRLLEGAVGCLLQHGVRDEDITVVKVPGAVEIPLAVQRLARTGQFSGIIALGCVIRGGTPHFDYVANEVSKGLSKVTMDADIPVSMGVLTTNSIEQAIERAGTKMGNKGVEAAIAALEQINILRKIDEHFNA
jgi:6,7-dimethyl-8-ribityllumazine synthase